jgi:hypothetical protein
MAQMRLIGVGILSITMNMLRLRLVPALLLTAIAVAGCGGSIESTVRSEYPAYSKRHHFDRSTQNVESVKCVKTERGSRYDAWCQVRPKGFNLTYDVPVKNDKPLWAKSGVGAAPADLF